MTLILPSSNSSSSLLLTLSTRFRGLSISYSGSADNFFRGEKKVLLIKTFMRTAILLSLRILQMIQMVFLSAQSVLEVIGPTLPSTLLDALLTPPSTLLDALLAPEPPSTPQSWWISGTRQLITWTEILLFLNKI